MTEDRRKEWLEKVEQLKQMFLRCAKGGPLNNTAYEALRPEFLTEPGFPVDLPDCVRRYSSLYDYRDYLQHRVFKTEKDRVMHVEQEFAPLLCALIKSVDMPSDEMITAMLANWSSAAVIQSWQKCLERRAIDPEGAITAARALLEGVCKHILDTKGALYDDNVELPKLYNLVATNLAIAPSQQTNDAFKRIGGGCSSVVEGLGALRNKAGDSHGKRQGAISMDARHAQLAVNLAGALASYLAETSEARK